MTASRRHPLTARDLRQVHQRVLAAAELAQREKIEGRLNFGAWDDDAFAKAYFTASDLLGTGRKLEDPVLRSTWAGAGTPLRGLKDLAAGGFLESMASRPDGAIAFRFSRGKCDAIAAELIATREVKQEARQS